MVRIIAPACPRCGGVDVRILSLQALFGGLRKLDPIDINLAQWQVVFWCADCGEDFTRPVNDCKAGLGLVEPAKVSE